MKKTNYVFVAIVTILLVVGCSKNEQAGPSKVTINLAQKGVDVPKGLWGIFYEEINRAGDGGLWPEMIYNMGFEEKNIPNGSFIKNGEMVMPKRPAYSNDRVKNYTFYGFNPTDVTEGWTLENNAVSESNMKVVLDKPLHEANPHSLQIDIASNDGGVKLINEGFKGIALADGESYNFQFYLRADKTYKGTVTASLIGKDGEAIYSEDFTVNNNGEWNNYASEIAATVTDNAVKLVLQFNTIGTVWVDYVSLLPQKTFMGHGLRQDIAQTLADMKPSFIRWPGGCVVEGASMDDRIQWKQTIGDRMARPGTFDLWGYRNTYNFGFHDFLQYSEDVGAVGMWVVNAGLACYYRNGDYYSMDEMDEIVQDVLDGIEYAIGDVDTKWGAERAKNGHPEPFPLKYVEIGNENFGPKYAERYNLIYDACVAKYPQLTYINNSSVDIPDYYDKERIDMVDPHYYVAPETFFNDVHLYDSVPRGNYDVYVGEYAVNKNVGSGTLEGALAEAAFMFGIEHNSDLVKIASYAPLLENVNWVHWPTNLIRFKNDSVFGRSSYYVQKMFNENKPDYTVKTTLDYVPAKSPTKGGVGFSAVTNGAGTNVSFKNFTVKQGENFAYESNLPTDSDKWEQIGSWEIQNGVFVTGAPKELPPQPPGQYIPGNPIEVAEGPRPKAGGGTVLLQDFTIDDDFTIFADVKREESFRGFSLRFGVKDDSNYYALTVAPQRRGFDATAARDPEKFKVTLEHVVNGTTLPLGTYGDAIDFKAGEWHNVKITLKDKMLSCSIDNKAIGQVPCKGLQKQYVVSGYDETDGELIVKVVNGEEVPFVTEINLENVVDVESRGKVITLTSDSNQDDNSFENPKKVAPVESTYRGFDTSFKMKFKPNSFTILRIKATK